MRLPSVFLFWFRYAVRCIFYFTLHVYMLIEVLSDTWSLTSSATRTTATLHNLRVSLFLRRPYQHCPGPERGNMYGQWWNNTLWPSHRWAGGSRDQLLVSRTRQPTTLDPCRFCVYGNCRHCGDSTALQPQRQSQEDFAGLQRWF